MFKRLILATLLLVAANAAQAQSALPTYDASGTITTGGTYQTITLPSGVRNSLDFVNICSVSGNCTSTSDSCSLYIGAGTPTAANSIPVPAGYEYLRSVGAVPNDSIKITCTSTGDKFYLKLQ